MELWSHSGLSLCSLPSLALDLLPYGSSSAHNLLDLSEWDLKSYLLKLFSQPQQQPPTASTKPQHQESQIGVIDQQSFQKETQERSAEPPDSRLFFHVIFQKKTSTLLVELIFLNSFQYLHAVNTIRQPKYHLINGVKVSMHPPKTLQEPEPNPRIHQKLIKNRSIWIRNLPSRLLELPPPPDIITEHHLVWILMNKMSGDGIERMEVANRSQNESSSDSFILFESDLCIRFTSYEECQRVFNLCCDSSIEQQKPSRSLVLCSVVTQEDVKEFRYIQKLEVTFDIEGYLRSTARHKRKRVREKFTLLKEKIDRDVAHAELELQDLRNSLNQLCRDYQDTLSDSNCSFYETAESDAMFALRNLTEVIHETKQKFVSLEESQVLSRLYTAQDKASHAIRYLETQFVFATDQQKKRREQLEAEKAQQCQRQIIAHGEKLLFELQSECNRAALAADQHDLSRKNYFSTLQYVDSSWISDPPQSFLTIFDQSCKQSRSLLSALSKLLSKKNSYTSIQTCCEMLDVEWRKVQNLIQTLSCIYEIETNIIYFILEKLKILLSLPHPDPIQSIILLCLRIISVIFERHQSLLNEEETSEWFDKILMASVAVRGIIDPLVQYLGTTEELMAIAERILLTSISSSQEIKSALNSTKYRLVRLESLASSILNKHIPSSISSKGVPLSQSEDINSFTNSCAVSHLELTSALMELETRLMSCEDQLSTFRETQDYLERQFVKERQLEMSLEDERSYLCDTIWFLERRMRMLQQKKIERDTDRWTIGHDEMDLMTVEPPWREVRSTSKRKRCQTDSEINEAKVNPLSPKENERELRRILLDRLSKKTFKWKEGVHQSNKG